MSLKQRCPACRGDRSAVVDSRTSEDGNRRRRRKCLNKECLHRWSTVEVNISRTQASVKKELSTEYRRQIVDVIRPRLLEAVNAAIEAALKNIQRKS